MTSKMSQLSPLADGGAAEKALVPLDDVARTVSLMEDDKRIDAAKSRINIKAVKNKARSSKVHRFTTEEFARKELRSLENHLG